MPTAKVIFELFQIRNQTSHLQTLQTLRVSKKKRRITSERLNRNRSRACRRQIQPRPCQTRLTQRENRFFAQPSLPATRAIFIVRADAPARGRNPIDRRRARKSTALAVIAQRRLGYTLRNSRPGRCTAAVVPQPLAPL